MKHSSCSIVGHLYAAQHANLCADQTPQRPEHWLEGSALGASGPLRDQPSRRRHKTDVKGKASRIEAHDEDG